jgi:tRNA U34 5-carboxymethylaminomethyl modifying GTPase MnmE/TrmE
VDAPLTHGVQVFDHPELAAEELRAAATVLGRVTGDTPCSEEMLGALFAEFCIGK